MCNRSSRIPERSLGGLSVGSGLAKGPAGGAGWERMDGSGAAPQPAWEPMVSFPGLAAVEGLSESIDC